MRHKGDNKRGEDRAKSSSSPQMNRAWLRADRIEIASAISGDITNRSAEYPVARFPPASSTKIHPIPPILCSSLQAPSGKQMAQQIHAKSGPSPTPVGGRQSHAFEAVSVVEKLWSWREFMGEENGAKFQTSLANSQWKNRCSVVSNSPQ
ncbi:unnamed protein product [Microthlaspi erraticum]|uniref:Uncharacterized protein n=1 Tax=Microthlaspi erraticum TaxID=1685480 RepID=A0A6D2JZ87_9BRAS|nr:unnamed protein product [Microthlaspi erraticum]